MDILRTFRGHPADILPALDVFNITELYQSSYLFKGATKKADNVATDSYAGITNVSNLAQTALD